MSTKEKLERFMRDRKKPVDTATLAAYFMVHTTTINENMRDLESEDKILRFKAKGGKNVWSWNYRLAFPPKPATARPVEPAPIVGAPIKATPSYAYVRGYDD